MNEELLPVSAINIFLNMMEKGVHSYKRFLFSVIFSILLSGPSHAIDCKKAAAPDEKIICDSEVLKNYDAAMSKIYNLILNSLQDDKKKLIEDQKSWLKERTKQADEPTLSNLYLQRIRNLCKTYEKVCKSFSEETLNKWQGDPKKLATDDSIIIASFFKANLTQFVDDKKVLNEIEDDVNTNTAFLEYVDLYKLDEQNILLTTPLFMAAYQGQSISFIYNHKDFQVVRFPLFNEKLMYPFTHSNYADWHNNVLIIHNRSQGYLYECGSTQYLKFEKGIFQLIKQDDALCSEQELENIQSGKLSPKDIKRITVYPKQGT